MQNPSNCLPGLGANSTRLFTLKPNNAGLFAPRPNWGQTAHDFLHSSQIVQDFLRPGRTVQDFFVLRKPKWVLGQIWPETARNHNFSKGILTGSRGQTFSRIMGSRRWRSKGPLLARLGVKRCRTFRTQANQCMTFCPQAPPKSATVRPSLAGAANLRQTARDFCPSASLGRQFKTDST